MSDLLDAHVAWMEEPRQRYRPRSIHDRRRVLIHADRHLPRGLDDVWPHELAAYIHRPGLSVWTAHTYDTHLRGFYRWATAAGAMTYDPIADLPTPPHGPLEPKPLEPHEIQFILQHSPEPWLTAVMLALGAGLRASEIAELEREDVTDSYVHIREGKGGRPRLIETCATLWAHVRDLPPGPLVRRPHGRGPVTGHYLSCRQRAHWLAIGMPHVHLHRFRHTFCTTMLDAGHDALILRDLMGHRSVTSTEGYARVSSRRRREAVRAIDALICGPPDMDDGRRPAQPGLTPPVPTGTHQEADIRQ